MAWRFILHEIIKKMESLIRLCICIWISEFFFYIAR